jgi:hypothetical protein
VAAQLAQRLSVVPVQLIQQLSTASVSQSLEYCIHLSPQYATIWLHVKPASCVTVHDV